MNPVQHKKPKSDESKILDATIEIFKVLEQEKDLTALARVRIENALGWRPESIRGADKEGNTLLHFIARSDLATPRFISLVLQNPIAKNMINCVNDDGRTAFQIATEKNNAHFLAELQRLNFVVDDSINDVRPGTPRHSPATMSGSNSHSNLFTIQEWDSPRGK